MALPSDGPNPFSRSSATYRDSNSNTRSVARLFNKSDGSSIERRAFYVGIDRGNFRLPFQ